MAGKKKIIKDSSISYNRVSKYVGVSWDRVHIKWVSTLYQNKVRYLCGYFDDDREAAKARDIKIISLGIKKPLQILKQV